MIDLVPGWGRASVNLALAANATSSGVVSIGDVWSVASAVGASATPEAWATSWLAVAEAWHGRAADAPVDADRALLHAGYAQLFAERLMPDGDRREATFQDAVRTIAEALPGFGLPCERVEIPYAGGTLPALWVPGTSSAAAVFLPGLDTTKEIWLALAAPELARIGMGVLFLDGPGQGEALRLAGLVLRHETETVVAAAQGWLAERTQVDARRVVVIGASLGGYLAARAAARTSGLAGVVIWGAVWDYHAVWAARLAGASAVPVDFTHLCRMTGTADPASAVASLLPMTLTDVVQDIDQPTLILHGALDTQVPVDQAFTVLAGVTAEDKTLVVFDDDDGGASHVQVDNLAVGLHRITAWLRDRLDLGTPVLSPTTVPTPV